MANQDDVGAELINGMRKLFNECGLSAQKIGAMYLESRALCDDDSEAALDKQALLVADIAAEGVQMAKAFAGMMAVASLAKLIGVNPTSILDAQATERKDGDVN